jgi:hypothetical protein
VDQIAYIAVIWVCFGPFAAFMCAAAGIAYASWAFEENSRSKLLTSTKLFIYTSVFLFFPAGVLGVLVNHFFLVVSAWDYMFALSIGVYIYAKIITWSGMPGRRFT